MTPSPRKVLHVTFNMAIGGTEQVIRQLITSTSGDEVQHAIACIDGYVGEIGKSLEEQGVTVYPVQRQPGFDRALVHSIHNIVRDGQFDIVHGHQYTPYLYAWLAARTTPARVVFTEHGRFHPDRYRYKAMLINPLISLMTPAVIAISRATARALSRYEFIPARKIRVIYNGIAGLHREPQEMARIRSDLDIPDKALVVGTVSRLDPVKNQTMMIRAFQRFREQMPDAILLMVGDGPERDLLEKLVADCGLADWVRFTGFIEQPQQYLALMDIFLLSSFTEGTSMTLLEAMSLGIPCVATRVGGNPEIVVDGETGFLVDSDDAEGFSGAMIRLAKEQETRKRFSDAGVRRFREHFSVNRMADEYLSVYQHCMGE